MKLNKHSAKRVMEREIPFPLIRLTVDKPDRVFQKSRRKRLYRKEIEGRLLDVVMRKDMLVTTYWREPRGEMGE